MTRWPRPGSGWWRPAAATGSWPSPSPTPRCCWPRGPGGCCGPWTTGAWWRSSIRGWPPPGTAASSGRPCPRSGPPPTRRWPGTPCAAWPPSTPDPVPRCCWPGSHPDPGTRYPSSPTSPMGPPRPHDHGLDWGAKPSKPMIDRFLARAVQGGSQERVRTTLRALVSAARLNTSYAWSNSSSPKWWVMNFAASSWWLVTRRSSVAVE